MLTHIVFQRKFLSILLLCALGCVDPYVNSEPNDDTSLPDASPNDDTSLPDASPNDTDEEDFRKPDLGDGIANGGLTGTRNCAELPCDGVRNRSGMGVRPHMHSAPAMREVWLYEDEYFVIDSAIVQGDQFFWVPGEFRVVALHEGRPLPIRYMEVEGPDFPSMDEIESWPESDYSTVQTIFREPYKYFNSTFVIPPWAFPEKGAYNVQLLILPIWQPAENHRFFFEDNSAYNKTYSIYYGSEEFYPHAEIEDRQDQAVIWENTAAGGYMAELDYSFLAPPAELFDWTDYPWESPVPAGELTRAFESSEREVSLDFLTINGEISDTFTTGQNLYYVLRNEEVIDMFLLEPPSMPP